MPPSTMALLPQLASSLSEPCQRLDGARGPPMNAISIDETRMDRMLSLCDARTINKQDTGT